MGRHISYTEDLIALSIIRVYGNVQTCAGALQLSWLSPLPKWQMPKWILGCVKCGNGFDYCRISDETMPLDLPFKPDVANGGQCVYRNCGQSAFHKSTDFLYRPESMESRLR
jgi:hypothetical protein